MYRGGSLMINMPDFCYDYPSSNTAEDFCFLWKMLLENK